MRKTLLAATAAATLAVPLAPAAPAVAQDYDCQIMIMGPSSIPGEVVDCVVWILISSINPPDLPPRS